jgi:hypothetical protein
MTFGTNGARRSRAWRGPALVLSVVAGLTGCSDILDVDNPNNLLEDNLGDPAAARPLVNGASATLARGIGAMLGPYSTATDEAAWAGSRDAWRELDQGNLSDPRNEFTDDAFRFINQGRWTTDEAVRRLEAFDQAKKLADRPQLARAYLFAAIAYTTIGDMFDNFVISDRREAGQPIGEANMFKMYDQAIQYADRGIKVAQETKSGDLETALLAMRARAKHGKAVWAKLNPAGNVPANPLVSDAGAAADARAVLARVGMSDYKFLLNLSNDDLALAGEASLAYNLFRRGELGIGPAFGKVTTKATQVNLKDPIDNVADPVITAELSRLQKAEMYQPVVAVSAREMHLILAEDALARSDEAEFAKHVNHVRAMDKLTPFSGQIPAADMLQHERRVNLFLQGRRLADMYRFGVRSPEWQVSPAATAVRTPGTFFPVTCIEIRSHPADFPGITC